METRKIIYNKLADKVELKSEKVEFALDLKQLESYTSTLKAKFSKYNQKFKVLDDMVRDIRSEAKELDKLSDRLLKELDEQEREGIRIAKELGVKFQDTAVGKKWENISKDYLSGKYDAIKRGLAINIK